MPKSKKMKFLDMKLTNTSVDDAEKKVMEMFKAVRELREEKVDVKLEFFAKKETKDPFDVH